MKKLAAFLLFVLLIPAAGQHLRPTTHPGKGKVKNTPTPSPSPTRTPMPYGDGIVTDRDAIVATGTFPTMALNTPTTDPTFGLTYTVIADNTFEGGLTSKPTVEYPVLSPFNSNSTRVWLNNGGGVKVADFDPETLLVSNWETVANFRAESFRFSRTDPDIGYSIDAVTFKKVLMRNFATDTTTVVKDFTGVLAPTGSLKQMSMSEDNEDVFAFTYNNGTVEKDYLVWKRSTDTILALERMDGEPDLNEIHINDTGEYGMAYGYNNTARALRFSGPDQTTITRWEFGDLWNGGLNAGVACMGHGDMGGEFLVGTDADGVHIYRSRWSDLLTSIEAFRSNSIPVYQGVGSYNYGMHIGYRNNSWAVVSMYNLSSGPYHQQVDEIFFVKVDIPDTSSKEIRRVQKGRGVRTGDNWDYGEVYKAGDSQDGRFIAFTTNNLEAGRSYVVVTKIAESQGAGAGGSEVTMQGVALSGVTMNP